MWWRAAHKLHSLWMGTKVLLLQSLWERKVVCGLYSGTAQLKTRTVIIFSSDCNNAQFASCLRQYLQITMGKFIHVQSEINFIYLREDVVGSVRQKLLFGRKANMSFRLHLVLSLAQVYQKSHVWQRPTQNCPKGWTSRGRHGALRNLQIEWTLSNQLRQKPRRGRDSISGYDYR